MAFAKVARFRLEPSDKLVSHVVQWKYPKTTESGATRAFFSTFSREKQRKSGLGNLLRSIFAFSSETDLPRGASPSVFS